MQYSDMPTWIVKRAPIEWELELHAGMSLPLRWGPFDIPPLSAGVLSCFELAYVEFFQNPLKADHYDMMRAIFIMLQREAAHSLCQQDRAFHKAIDKDFSFDDIATWSLLDTAAVRLFETPGVAKELFSEPSRLALWRWIDSSFSGYRMIHGGSSAPASEWMFGLDSLAGYVRLMGLITNEKVFTIIWRLPIALASHMAAAHTQANSLEAKIYREPDHAQIDRLRAYIKETEDKGELLYWQKAYPDRYDLSEAQAKTGGEKLCVEFGKLREDIFKMTREERDRRAAEIIERERVD